MSNLPTVDKERKSDWPLWTFLFEYFPKAWLEVVRVAVVGNKQHNPGERLRWAREKSTDQLNTAFRHLFDYGLGVKKDTDGVYHLAKAIWRLSAQLQLDIEAEEKAGPATGVRDPSQPIPPNRKLVHCKCRERVFDTDVKGEELGPQVYGADGTLHAPSGCVRV